jgi:hypothetical protein
MAEPAENTQTPAEGNTTANGATDVNKGSGTFTQEQLGKKLSEERTRMREQFDKEKQQAVNDAIAEYERKAKLTEDERQKEAFAEREAAVEKREREITMRERRSEALAIMSERNIPTNLVDYVVDEDEATTKSNIEALDKEWRKALEEGIKAKIGSGTPHDKSQRTNTQGVRKFGRDNGQGITSF